MKEKEKEINKLKSQDKGVSTGWFTFFFCVSVFLITWFWAGKHAYEKCFDYVVGQRDSLQRELNDVGDQRLYYYNELQKQKEEYERLSEEYKYMRQNASWWRSGDNHILNKYNE